MTLKELMDKASPVPWSDANSPNAALMVHCVNNFAPVVEALRDALGQLDDYNAESASNSRWAEWHSALAAAQTIPHASCN